MHNTCICILMLRVKNTIDPTGFPPLVGHIFSCIGQNRVPQRVQHSWTKPCKSLSIGHRICILLQEKPTLWSRILDVVVGPQGKEGTWMALKQRDSRFVNQYGPLFEMNLGPPMVLSDVTYEQDPKTGYCYRGQLVPMYEKPVLKLG